MSNQFFKEIFCIVGYERSGTTMLRSILHNSSEMNVHLIEPRYILEMYKIFGVKITNISKAINFLYKHKKFPRYGSDVHNATEERLSLETLQSIYKDITEISLGDFFLKFYYELYSGNLQSKLLIKHPESAYHLNILKKVFPDVKIINIIRDARSAIASSFARWPSKSFTYRCNRWNRSISLSKEWGVKNPDHYLEVIYENILTDFNSSLDKICKYLEISMEDKMMHFHYHQRQWSVHNGYEEKEFKGVDQTKLHSWKKQLNTEQVYLIEKNCKKWMKEYNYVFSNSRLKGYKNYLFVFNDQTKYVVELVKTKVLHKVKSIITNKLIDA
ncbi:MAG: sulfotransferase [Ginsengibacter sp.]